MNRPFKPDSPFFIGTMNIFEYQRTGIRRWGAFLAQLPEISKSRFAAAGGGHV